jgi:uncharacterized BrkB/YihY/UPF0761 family membrane protein
MTCCGRDRTGSLGYGAGRARLGMVKTLGRLYVQHTEANPAYRLVAGSVGLLVFLNAINQMVLFAGALAATSTHRQSAAVGHRSRR